MRDGRLTLAPSGTVEADRFVALPAQHGIELDGVPHVPGGFIPVDEHGRVEGLTNVFAAGDITNYSVKQGGIAAQQADAVAQVIAAEAGAAILPEPFRPVIRSVLLTGNGPRYLSSHIRNGSRSSRRLRRPSRSGRPPTRSPRRSSRPTSRGGSRARCGSGLAGAFQAPGAPHIGQCGISRRAVTP